VRTRWTVDPVRSSLHFAAQGGATDLHYAISDGCLELTGVAPANAKLIAVLKLSPPVGQRRMQNADGGWADVSVSHDDIEIRVETTEIDPSVHRAVCEVVLNGAHFPLMLTTTPQLVDMRRGILVLTASGNLEVSALGLGQPTNAPPGTVVPWCEVGMLTLRLSAWSK
jgi:hypothetical protein